MLHLIVTIFQTVVDIFYYIFVISFRLGNLIYNLIKLFAFFLFTVFDAIGRLLVILYEDYATFFFDVNSKLEAIFAGINFTIDIVFKSTYEAGLVAVDQFTYIFTTGRVKISNVGEVLTELSRWLLINIKVLFVLIGNGCWFLITLLPNFILYLLHLSSLALKFLLQICVLLFINLYKGLCHGLIEIINYFADIPIKSAIGVVIGILIYNNFSFISPILKWIGRIMLNRWIRSCRQIYQWIISKLVIVSNRIRHVQVPSLTQLFSLTPRAPINIAINPRDDVYQTPPPRNNEKTPPGHQHSSGKKLLCVICQDQEKCMLLLPCRHLCVCFDCSGKSRYYNNKCPICRRSINDKVRIYV